MPQIRVTNNGPVELTPQEEADLMAQWAAFVPRKRQLRGWAFRRVLQEAGLTAPILAILEGLPVGEQRSRVLGKFNHGTSFNAYDPDMVSLSAVAAGTVPGFDFDALWAAAEALQNSNG